MRGLCRQEQAASPRLVGHHDTEPLDLVVAPMRDHPPNVV